MIKVTLTNEILKRISEIDEKRFSLSSIEMPPVTKNRLRKNSKKKSSYASNKIEGTPLTEKQANSLEVRVPFLDKEVFEVARHVQPDYRVNREATKYAFRMAAKDYLPEEVASKKKLGFPVPTRVWLKDEKYYNIVKTAFQSEAAQKYFNTDKIVKYLDDHKNGKADNSRKVWTIYMFLVWYNQFFGNEEKEACLYVS